LAVRPGYAVRLSSNAFVPGAFADSLTSYAGLIFGGSGGQTPLLVFLNAGASGSYGTVTEPCAYLQKFPSPAGLFLSGVRVQPGGVLLHERRQSLSGIDGGRAAGRAFRPATGRRVGQFAGQQHVERITNLMLQSTAAASNRPISAGDLFVDAFGGKP